MLLDNIKDRYLIHGLVCLYHGLVDHVPAVSKEVVEKEEDHEGEGEDEGRHEHQDDHQRN